MGRFPQSKGARGSLKWIQLVVNDCPELINMPLSQVCKLPVHTPISWVSPIRKDGFAEYRDQAFLDLLRVHLEQRPLKTFWPSRGPQWDALGLSDCGDVFLVEAKAHVSELLSPGTKASSHSREFIERSLKEVQSFFGVDPIVNWSQVFYQYTNRLSHLYLLRELNNVPAFLVFVYFVGDYEMDGPSTIGEWQSALRVVKGVLDLREGHKLSKYILDVFIDISQINDVSRRESDAHLYGRQGFPSPDVTK